MTSSWKGPFQKSWDFFDFFVERLLRKKDRFCSQLLDSREVTRFFVCLQSFPLTGDGGCPFLSPPYLFAVGVSSQWLRQVAFLSPPGAQDLTGLVN